MQRQAKKRSGDAGGAGGTKRAVTPRSAFIVLACTAIAEYFAFYLRLADAGAKAGIPHGGYVRIDLRSCFTCNNGGIRLAFVC